MILHCGYDMTEPSSVNCFRRCLTRCFGVERYSITNTKKNGTEPSQNGFTQIDGEKSNGFVVKVLQPNSNGCNKQVNKTVGEKTCCVSIGKSDKNESKPQYAYEHISSKKIDNSINGNLTAVNTDNLSNGSSNDFIDTRSDDSLLISQIDQKNGLRPLRIDGTHLLSNGLHKEPKIEDIELTMKGSLGGSLLEEICNVSSSINSLVSQEKENSLKRISDSFCKKNSVHFINGSENCAKPEMGIATTCQKDVSPSLLNIGEPASAMTLKDKNIKVAISEEDEICKQRGSQRAKEIQENGDSEGEHDVSYFKSLVETETSKLNEFIAKWETVLSNQPDIHEEVRDEIRSVNGQTHLVISERFTQFKSLVEQSEQQSLGNRSPDTKIITLTDLQGFWDMIYFQVQDVLAKFQRLNKIKESDWNIELLHENKVKLIQKKPVKKQTNTRKRVATKKTASLSNAVSEEEKARRLAARKRLAEARKKLAEQTRTQKSNEDNFIIQ